MQSPQSKVSLVRLEPAEGFSNKACVINYEQRNCNSINTFNDHNAFWKKKTKIMIQET